MLTKLKIYNLLYVEDDEMIASSMAGYLNRFFKEVIYFSNGKDAYDYMQDNNDVDVLVTDITMPHMNGIDLIRLIRTKLNSNIPAIALSAHTKEFADDLEELQVPLICKPVEMEQLISKLLDLLV